MKQIIPGCTFTFGLITPVYISVKIVIVYPSTWKSLHVIAKTVMALYAGRNLLALRGKQLVGVTSSMTEEEEKSDKVLQSYLLK